MDCHSFIHRRGVERLPLLSETWIADRYAESGAAHHWWPAEDLASAPLIDTGNTVDSCTPTSRQLATHSKRRPCSATHSPREKATSLSS